MNRRQFNTMSFATLCVSLPQLAFTQPAKSGLPGYQIAEITNGRSAVGYGGMATAQTDVTRETLFQAASCSKTVAALAVLTLVRDGRIAIDAPANSYLKRWQLPGSRGATATIAELMSHTAGTTVHGFAGYGADEDIPSLLDILNGSAPANSDAIRTRRMIFSQFSYSGGGSTVLQAVIEDVTGTDFATYTTAEVLRPVGAPRATFAIRPTAPFAYGAFENGQPVPGGFRRHPESAAAGLWATALDLAKVLHAVVRSVNGASDAIIPVALAQRMITPVAAQSGLGVFVRPGAIIEHTGSNYGFNAVMAADLNTGTVRAAVTNQNGAIDGYIERVTTG